MSIPHAVTPCPDCGAPLGGREECDAAFHELGAHASSDLRFAYRRRAIVDAYCPQHPAYVRTVLQGIVEGAGAAASTGGIAVVTGALVASYVAGPVYPTAARGKR